MMCHKRFLVALTFFVATWIGNINGASAAPSGHATVKMAVAPLVAVSHAHKAQLAADSAVAFDHRQDDGVDIDDDDVQDVVCGDERYSSLMADPRQRIPEQRDQEFARLRWPAIAARGPPAF